MFNFWVRSIPPKPGTRHLISMNGKVFNSDELRKTRKKGFSKDLTKNYFPIQNLEISSNTFRSIFYIVQE